MFQHYILIFISHSEKPYWVIKSLRSCSSWTLWSISGKVQLILFTCSYALVLKWPLFTVLSRINLSTTVTSISIGCGLTRPTIIELISLLWCLLLLPPYDTLYTLPIISICNWLCRIGEFIVPCALLIRTMSIPYFKSSSISCVWLTTLTWVTIILVVHLPLGRPRSDLLRLTRMFLPRYTLLL